MALIFADLAVYAGTFETLVQTPGFPKRYDALFTNQQKAAETNP